MQIICLLVPLIFCYASAQTCGSKGIYCLNETTYQTCWSSWWWIDYSTEYYLCDNGTYCDQDNGNSSCLDVTSTTSTTPSTTTTPAPSLSACGAKGIHCLDDSIYQTCWWFLWWAKYGSEYYSCDPGYVCDQETGDTLCVPSTTTTTEPPTTTTSTQATTPSCGSYRIYCLNSTTYQTCKTDWWWVDYYYFTCPDGTVCDDTNTDNCTAASTTPTPTGIDTVIDNDSDCGSKGIHCINDYAYQTCWYFLRWVKYDSGYYTCDAGTICDQENGSTNCIVVA